MYQGASLGVPQVAENQWRLQPRPGRSRLFQRTTKSIFVRFGMGRGENFLTPFTTRSDAALPDFQEKSFAFGLSLRHQLGVIAAFQGNFSEYQVNSVFGFVASLDQCPSASGEGMFVRICSSLPVGRHAAQTVLAGVLLEFDNAQTIVCLSCFFILKECWKGESPIAIGTGPPLALRFVFPD
jgi:hypothetical protein